MVAPLVLMKSILLYASVAALSAACAFAACTPKADDKDDDAGGTGNPSAGGEGNSSTAGKKSTGTDAGGDTTSNGGQPSSSGGEPSSSVGGESSSGTATSITSCGTGLLLEGDPLWTDYLDGVKPAGQGLFDDPPIRSEAIAVIGNMLFVETEFEIWSADMSQKTPKISRFAGVETMGDTFIDAGLPCKDTRFLVIRDMVAKPNGKLAVVDYVGGAIIEITDPAGPGCKSDWVAGTHMRTADPADFPLAQGDQDGPGADALFGDVGGGGGVVHITTDPDGNLYTFDNGTGKFKMIANESDPDRTVSTIGQGSGDDNVIGLAFLKGKLYASGVDGSNDFLIEIDPAKYSKAKPKDSVHDVFRARDHFADVEASHQAVLSQMISDGEALIITGDSGYIWRVAADGTVLATLAGTGVHLEYDPVGEDPFDPTSPHPANEWWLNYSLSNSFGGPWLALSDSKLYWSGGAGTGKHIVQFSCK
jgi:hypothetical protein